MAEKNIGKITQIIGAVLDIKYADGHLPEINEADPASSLYALDDSFL